MVSSPSRFIGAVDSINRHDGARSQGGDGTLCRSTMRGTPWHVGHAVPYPAGEGVPWPGAVSVHGAFHLAPIREGVEGVGTSGAVSAFTQIWPKNNLKIPKNT